MNSKRVYFAGFNGIRFLAALAVIVHHIEQIKSEVSLPNAWGNTFIQSAGRGGVNLFFVLSGFLITYLLLEEEERFGSISIRHFYLRRVLRIHPVYFLVLIFAFALAPHFPLNSTGIMNGFLHYNNELLAVHYMRKLSLFLVMAPNLALILYPAVLFAAQGWSIGVEEQFYLFWPWLLKAFKGSSIRSLAALILAKFLLNMMLSPFQSPGHSPAIRALASLIIEFRLDSLAMGGLAACSLLKYPHKIRSWFSSPIIQYLMAPLVLFFLATETMFPSLRAIWPAFYTILLLNLATDNSPRLLENSLFNRLGKISYGLYMYHVIAIVATLKIIERFCRSGLRDTFYLYPTVMNVVVYSGVLLLTISIAQLSYDHYERLFLNLKGRFGSLSDT